MDERSATFIIVGDLLGGPLKLSRRRILIGSGSGCDLRLKEHFTISESHAYIEWDGEDFYLTDADPANATFVNHRQAEFNVPEALAGRDTVQVGPYVLTLERDESKLRIEVSDLLIESKFVIKRSDSDKTSDAVSCSHEVLLICNPPDQADAGYSDGRLILNHPKVAALHAGISRFLDPLDETKTRFCIIALSPSSRTYLDNRLLDTDEPTALATGSVAQIGPYDLSFSLAGEETLHIDVTLSVAGTAAPGGVPQTPAARAGAMGTAQVAADALKIFWAKRKRDHEPVDSPLHPAASERLGKARYKWQATTDLVRAWPLNLLLWCALAAALVLAGIALTGMTAFSPRPVSAAHASAAFVTEPATAKQPNANACMTCHALGRSMNEQCASCHQAAGVFVATVTPKHRAAGIGCVNCHTEHHGASFRPGIAPLSASFQPHVNPEVTCAGCHNDANDKLYNGRRVSTPHSGEHKGKFGYPTSPAGEWLWRGLDPEEWALKLPSLPAEFRREDYTSKPSAEFHGLHLGRASARAVGLPGNNEGLLSCSSCHTHWDKNPDRETPRQTCGKCHNGRVDARTGRALIAPDQPDCTSCHVQHVMDRRPKFTTLVPAGNNERP